LGGGGAYFKTNNLAGYGAGGGGASFTTNNVFGMNARLARMNNGIAVNSNKARGVILKMNSQGINFNSDDNKVYQNYGIVI
jgi:hypothetical protein